MLDFQDVWPRASRYQQFQGMGPLDFVNQVNVLSFTLTTGAVSPQTAQTFPAGAIILGIMASAIVTGAAATQQYKPGLDSFSVAIDMQTPARNLVGSTAGIGSSVFGPYGDQFPAKEMVMGLNAALLYTVTNQTTSTLLITFAHHVLIPTRALA